jgi:hypothetical protein
MAAERVIAPRSRATAHNRPSAINASRWLSRELANVTMPSARP